MAWARVSIVETFKTICYNHKHVCFGNLDYCIRVTGWLAGFLSFVYGYVHFDLDVK